MLQSRKCGLGEYDIGLRYILPHILAEDQSGHIKKISRINLELKEDCLRHVRNLGIGYTCAVIQTMIVYEVSKLDMKK